MQGLEIYTHMRTTNTIAVEGLEWEGFKHKTIKQLGPLYQSTHQEWVDEIVH